MPRAQIVSMDPVSRNVDQSRPCPERDPFARYGNYRTVWRLEEGAQTLPGIRDFEERLPSMLYLFLSNDLPPEALIESP